MENLIAESNAIDAIIGTAKTLPEKDKAQIKLGMENYLSLVIQAEWPALQNQDINKREIATPEFLALDDIINNIAYKLNQSIPIASQLLSSIEDIRRTRKIRLALAYDNDSLAKWPSVPACSFFLLLSVGIIHIGRNKAMILSLGVASICIITALILLFVIVSPYRGWYPLAPIQLEDSMKLLNALKS